MASISSFRTAYEIETYVADVGYEVFGKDCPGIYRAIKVIETEMHKLTPDEMKLHKAQVGQDLNL